MLKPILRAALLAGTCAVQLAHADIYTWTDETGRVNVSNLAPPEGARVTKVIHESAGKPVARSDAAREALREAEVRLLAERVKQLQDEIDVARRPAPTPVIVQAAPAAPPIIQYITVAAPQYPAVPPEPVNTGCGFGWPDCTFGWYPGFYPAAVFVSRDKHFDHRSDHRSDHRADHRRPPKPTAPGRGLIAPWLPITAPGGRGN